MTLAFRMFLYFAFAFLTSQGIGVFDPETGMYSVSVESIEASLGGLVGFLATFGWSRHEKSNGGLT